MRVEATFKRRSAVNFSMCVRISALMELFCERFRSVRYDNRDAKQITSRSGTFDALKFNVRMLRGRNWSEEILAHRSTRRSVKCVNAEQCTPENSNGMNRSSSDRRFESVLRKASPVEISPSDGRGAYLLMNNLSSVRNRERHHNCLGEIIL